MQFTPFPSEGNWGEGGCVVARSFSLHGVGSTASGHCASHHMIAPFAWDNSSTNHTGELQDTTLNAVYDLVWMVIAALVCSIEGW